MAWSWKIDRLNSITFPHIFSNSRPNKKRNKNNRGRLKGNFDKGISILFGEVDGRLFFEVSLFFRSNKLS